MKWLFCLRAAEGLSREEWCAQQGFAKEQGGNDRAVETQTGVYR